MQIKIDEDMETKDEMYGHAILRLREIEHFIYNIMRENGYHDVFVSYCDYGETDEGEVDTVIFSIVDIIIDQQLFLVKVPLVNIDNDIKIKDHSNVNFLESIAHSLFKEFDRMSDSEMEEMNDIFGPSPI